MDEIEQLEDESFQIRVRILETFLMEHPNDPDVKRLDEIAEEIEKLGNAVLSDNNES